MASIRSALLPAICLLACAHPAVAVNERLEVELWIDLEPVVVAEGDEEYPLSRRTAVTRLLEEARTVISSMVYGYAFVYTPSDVIHRVQEVFGLEPLAEIVWGDPGLRVRQTRVLGTRLHAVIDYALADHQQVRRDSWSSGVIPRASGVGSGNVFLGFSERRTAFENAIKEAIRAHLRPRVFNKPREVRGEVLLWDTPSTHVASGEYFTRLNVKIRITDIVPYREGS